MVKGKTWGSFGPLLMASLWVVGCAGGGGVGGEVSGGGLRYVMTAPQEALVECRADAPPRKWAVVVGVDAYRDERIPDLKGAVNDAWSFYHYLTSPKGGAIPAVRMKLLLNDQANQPSVVGALGGFLARACEQDQVIIYFAGHGLPEPERPEEAFLLLHDTDLDNLVATAVSMTQLPNFLEWRAGKAGRLLMLVDACHSGNISFPGGKRGFKATDRINLVTDSVGKLTAGHEGWGAISAAASDQFAQEVRGCKLGGVDYYGGLFTCHLLQGLSGAADTDKDSNVSLDEIYTHLEASVKRDSNNVQTPLRSGSLEGSFVLGQAATGPIEIPVVPERYQLAEEPADLAPYLWTGAGLTGAALLTGGIFHLFAESQASDFNNVTENNPGARTIDQTASDIDSHDLFVNISQTAYITGGALALSTLGIWLADALITPQDIDDVYELPPWFELNFVPTPQGAAIQGSW